MPGIKEKKGLWWMLGISAGMVIIGVATRTYMRSKYFNIDDVNSVRSAKKNKIKGNSIPDQYLPNAQGLALHILDPMFEAVGDIATVTINTWYRNKKLNEAVGGADNSKHLIGAASDVGLSTQEGFKRAIANILRNSKFDRLAVYLNKDNKISYFHVEWSDTPSNLVYYETPTSGKWIRTSVKELMRFIN